MLTAKFRPLAFGVTQVSLRHGNSGVQYLSVQQALREFPSRITDRLAHWAGVAPERTFVAKRAKTSDGKTGGWQLISYAQAWASARCIAQALIHRGLNAERPVAILSENDLDHALLALGCMVAGVPFAPVSPAYSLISQDFDKLRHVLKTTTPGLVFAVDGDRCARAIHAAVSSNIEVVLSIGGLEGRSSTAFAEMLTTPETPAVDAAMQATGPDSIVKFLFTSGSTKLPKAVINTQRMCCAK